MNPDDRRLIADALAGHADAFGVLVARHQDRLYNSVLRVVDSPDDALDAVQDAFINAYQNLGSFKGDSEFTTWLYRIAFNTAISHRRKRRATVSLDAGKGGGGRDAHDGGRGGFDPADPASLAGPGADLERTEEERLLAAALARLSPEHRAVVVMKDIDGLKYEEIAAALDVPIGTVRSRIHRARAELKDLLEPLLGDGAG